MRPPQRALCACAPLTLGYALGAAAQVPNAPRLLACALGGEARLPAPPAVETVFAPPARLAAGGGPLPNLQRAAPLGDAAAWRSILIDGALKDGGMVSFARVMSPAQAETVRRYIIDEANWAKANGVGS